MRITVENSDGVAVDNVRVYLEPNIASGASNSGPIGFNDDEIEVVEEFDLDYNPFVFADVSNIDSQIINT